MPFSDLLQRPPPLILLVSYIIDWVVLVLIAAVGQGFSYITPRKRPFNLAEPSISFPHTDETVSTAVLLLASLVIPAGVIFVSSIFIGLGPTTQKHSRVAAVQRKLWEWHAGWLGLAMALAVAYAITNGTKEIVGKPRPDLLSRCNPDLSRLLNSTVGGIGEQVNEGINLVSSNICRGKGFEFDEGFRSFPSGHSSASFAGLTYLALWICAKLGVAIPVLSSSVHERTSHENAAQTTSRTQGAAPPTYVLIFPLIPIGAAIFIASSRYSDFRHHGLDVITGSVLGIACAWLGFRWYHLPVRRGGGWAWAPRSHKKAFVRGMGLRSYAVDDNSNSHGDFHYLNQGTTMTGGYNNDSQLQGWHRNDESEDIEMGNFAHSHRRAQTVDSASSRLPLR